MGVNFKKLIIYKNFLKLFSNSGKFTTNEIKVKMSSATEAYLEYQDVPFPPSPNATLVFESEHRGNAMLLKYLRVKKRGTGVEYGF